METNDKNYLLNLVGRVLENTVNGKIFTPTTPTSPALLELCGCFVTYKTHQQLRGCLGCFIAEKPLYLTIADYARYAITDDPRFANNRLTPTDLPNVEFDISVLSPLTQCTEPEKITLGVHGIYLKSGNRSGCFLPQVATETGWNIAEFWGNCCAHKAGLPYDYWQDKNAQLFTFTAEIIEGHYTPYAV